MPSGLPPAARTWEVIPESLHRITHQYAKKRQDFLPLFAFYQNLSAGTNPGHHFPLCARTASRLSLGPAGGDSLAIPGTEGVCLGFSPLRCFG